MDSREIRPGIFSVGAIDWDRELFDALIPLPDGTSYNSYLIQGSEKTALIDTVYPPKKDTLLTNLKNLSVNRLDYIIANHAEPDHSGCISVLLEIYPSAKIVTNAKCKGILKDQFFFDDSQFIVISDRETLSLGDKTFEFIIAPWVHWPDTMLTYLKEDKIMFTCDLFGSHYSTSELFANNEAKYMHAAKRYYAEIMMPFRKIIKKHLNTLAEYDIELLAASHGPVNLNPNHMINAYQDWISDDVKNEIIIPYVSMYGNTTKMVEYLINSFAKKNFVVRPFNIITTDMGELIEASVDASTIIFGTSTVLGGAHPAVANAAFLLNAVKPKTKYVSLVGSYGWGTTVSKQLKSMLYCLQAEFIDPVLIKGYPSEEDYSQLEAFAKHIHEKHNNNALSAAGA